MWHDAPFTDPLRFLSLERERKKKKRERERERERGRERERERFGALSLVNHKGLHQG